MYVAGGMRPPASVYTWVSVWYAGNDGSETRPNRMRMRICMGYR